MEKGCQITEPEPTGFSNRRYRELHRWVYVERLKHTLAFQHFDYMAFVFIFLPITAITLASGILSLFVTLNYNEGSASNANGGQQGAKSLKVNLVLASGILSFVATFFNALQDRLQFRTRAKMHEAASLQLKNMMFELDVLGARTKDPQSDEFEAELTSFERSFLGVQEGNTSIIPHQISEPFNVLINKSKELFWGENQKYFQRIYYFENHFYAMACNELSGTIAGYSPLPYFYRFPLFLPHKTNKTVDLTVKRITERIREQMSKKEGIEDEKYKGTKLCCSWY